MSSQGLTQKQELIDCRSPEPEYDDVHPLVRSGAPEPVREGEHPSRTRTFEQAVVSNIRNVRDGFEPRPFKDNFFRRPTVIIFIVLYVFAGIGIPLWLMQNHYMELHAEGGGKTLLVEDNHKRRVATVYLCMIPLTLLAIPVFLPSMATISIMPYCIIMLFGVKEALDEIVQDEFKHFLNHALSHPLATMCAFTFLRLLDYLDHLMHEIMVSEDAIVQEKPIKKMQGILHSVGVTRSGNPSKDKFLSVTNTCSIANVIYEKVWCTMMIVSKIIALATYLVFTLVSEEAGTIMMAASTYYFLMAVFISYKFWDQAAVLLKVWMHKPFFVGDLVTIKLIGRPVDSGIDGFIEHITLSYVIVRTFDCKETYLPLTELSEAVVQNWSRRPTKPLLMMFTASPGCGSEAVDALVRFAKDWIDQSPQVLQTGYKKCCLNGLAHGFDIKIVVSPAIGVHKTALRGAFILALTAQAERLGVSLASEDATSVFLPDGLAAKKAE